MYKCYLFNKIKFKLRDSVHVDGHFLYMYVLRTHLQLSLKKHSRDFPQNN